MNKVEQNLKDRHVQTDRYTVSWDDDCATFLLFNLSGQITGYQNYKWYADKTRNNDPRSSRYFTYQPKGVTAVFGLETYLYRTDVLFIVEGIMDAVRLHNLNLPCLAVLSCDPKPIKSWLRTLNRHIVAICDNDENKSGLKLAKYGDVSITLTDEKDLGDMTSQEVQEIVKDYI